MLVIRLWTSPYSDPFLGSALSIVWGPPETLMNVSFILLAVRRADRGILT